jgi:hypothetical protein
MKQATVKSISLKDFILQYSDRPKPEFEPKPKAPKFRFVWAETETKI